MLLGVRYNILTFKEKFIISSLNIVLYLLVFYKIYILFTNEYDLSNLNSNIYYAKFSFFITSLVIVNYILFYELRESKYRRFLYFWLMLSLILGVTHSFFSFYSVYHNISFMIFIILMIFAYMIKLKSRVTIKISIVFIIIFIIPVINILFKIKDNIEFKNMANIEQIKINNYKSKFSIIDKNKIKKITTDLKSSKLYLPTINTNEKAKLSTTLNNKNKSYNLKIVYGICLNDKRVDNDFFCNAYIDNGFIVKYKSNFYYNIKLNVFLRELIRNKIDYKGFIKIYKKNKYNDTDPFLQETSLLFWISLFYLLMILLLITINEFILVRDGKKTIKEAINFLRKIHHD